VAFVELLVSFIIGLAAGFVVRGAISRRRREVIAFGRQADPPLSEVMRLKKLGLNGGHIGAIIVADWLMIAGSVLWAIGFLGLYLSGTDKPPILFQT
jgi:hypothetical protein